MLTEWHVLLVYWGLPVSVALIIVVWLCWVGLAKLLAKPTYDELVEERDRLRHCVSHWRYPDGSFVPQHKRQRMFGEMRRLSRKIRNHPDHPGWELPAARTP
jgi:hypothetical protein